MTEAERVAETVLKLRERAAAARDQAEAASRALEAALEAARKLRERAAVGEAKAKRDATAAWNVWAAAQAAAEQ